MQKKREKYGKTYTDKQILEIRDTVYQIAKHQLKDLKEGLYDELSKINSTFNQKIKQLPNK